jgi:ABC-type sugar transport system ATPase subunit
MTRLRLLGISKSFSGVKVLDNINLEILAGEVHAICGENGAGKSTLMNILSGNLQQDNGTVALNGSVVEFRNPQEAFNRGISIVHQHLSLSDNLSVAENIFTNQHPLNRFGLIDYPQLYRQTTKVLEDLNFRVSPSEMVSALSPAQKQMVEIGKSLVRNPQVLILDEPTASLADIEINSLFKIIRSLREGGVSILYISHRIQEIFQIADRVSVLKDGKHQGTYYRQELSREMLIKRMVGRDLSADAPSKTMSGRVMMEVQDLTGEKFSNISFSLHEGEIVGLAGLVGAGRTEIARVLFGIDTLRGGTISVNDLDFRPGHPCNAIDQGIGYVPEDRKALGLFPEMSVRENLLAASINQFGKAFVDDGSINETASYYINKLNIICRSPDQSVRQLSGGNQQKVLLGRWLSVHPKILIVDEPTHGVDVGAKQEIYNMLRELASQGMGIIMISSELPELLALSNRILVIREGALAGSLVNTEFSEEVIMALATK